MAKKYYFETEEFGLSDTGVHLLRSRFNYDTIEYKQIASATVERSKELNNWLIVLIIGLGFIAFSLFYTVRMYQIIDKNEVSSIYIEELLVPVIPFLLGGYCIYAATRHCKVIKIRTAKNRYKKLSLSTLEKSHLMSDFKAFASDKLIGKIRFND